MIFSSPNLRNCCWYSLHEFSAKVRDSWFPLHEAENALGNLGNVFSGSEY